MWPYLPQKTLATGGDYEQTRFFHESLELHGGFRETASHAAISQAAWRPFQQGGFREIPCQKIRWSPA